MDINEYKLALDTPEGNFQLIYRGNENIIVKWINEKGDEFHIRFPRVALEKFIELIKGC